MKGWLLTEEFRLDEALPLLQRAIAANPNDASSHRFLGNLYDRRGDPNSALSHFSAAASLDPLDFISHVFRCQELIDLGELDEAEAACARARELEPTNLWGPLATSWIARAQGDTARAPFAGSSRHASSRQPMTWLADQTVDLLVTQGTHEEARALMRELPGGRLFRAWRARPAWCWRESGAAALQAWLLEHEVADKAAHRRRAQSNSRACSTSPAMQPRRAPRWRTRSASCRCHPPTCSTAARFVTTTLSRCSTRGIELKGGGDTAHAMTMLQQLDQHADDV